MECESKSEVEKQIKSEVTSMSKSSSDVSNQQACDVLSPLLTVVSITPTKKLLEAATEPSRTTNVPEINSSKILKSNSK